MVLAGFLELSPVHRPIPHLRHYRREVMPFLSIRRLLCIVLYLPALAVWVGIDVPTATAEPIPAIHVQGSMHGFLLLKSADGKVIGVGDQISVAKGNQVRSKLTF